MSWITEEDRISRGDYDPPSCYQTNTQEFRFFRPDGTFFDKSVVNGTQQEYAQQNGLKVYMASWNYGPNRTYK